MPTYEYQCETCGYKFEKFQSIREEPIKICSKCNGGVKRLISSGAGFIFKGKGFYITDYRSESYKKRQKEEQPASVSQKESKEQTKSEKKETKTSTEKITPGNSEK